MKTKQLQPTPRPLPQPILPPWIRDGQVIVKTIEVNTVIREGIAETEVTHVFFNPSSRPQEGDFVFPIPAGAEVSSFAMYDGEQKLSAQLLSSEEATSIYEQIVRQKRDPALLTYAGRQALRARVFPIAPNSERKLKIKLIGVLPKEGAMRKFSWTLVGPHLPANSQPDISIRIVMQGGQGVGNVYSPTHELKIERVGENSTQKVIVTAHINKEAGSVISEHPEFELYLNPSNGKYVALSTLAYNASLTTIASIGGGILQSGYFMVLASPTVPEAGRSALPRRVVMVMDRSGSMQGKKIEQARGALKQALQSLRPMDYFNIFTFSDTTQKFSPTMLSATSDNLKRALGFVEDIVADGGTNINQALTEAIAQFAEKGTGNTLLFFTDGLPTVGERSQEQIVANAHANNNRKCRAFVFGVGYDVDVPFLDTVATHLRGDADYVRPDEDIEAKTASFVRKTSAPVLENLKIRVEGARTGDIYPRPDDLPDLFNGGQLVLVGRYTGVGKVGITLSGEANGKPQSYALSAEFPAVNTDSEFLPRLWAARKIGYLQDEVRLMTDASRKQETIDQIIALAKEFGVLTPYTALFVPEPGTSRPTDHVRYSPNSSGGGGLGAPMSPRPMASKAAKGEIRGGEAAVNASQGARAQRSTGAYSNSAYANAQSGADKDAFLQQSQRIQRVKSRTFYSNGKQWQDAGYDAKKQKEIVKIKLYSDAYFSLTRRKPDMARWAALGEDVLIVANAKQAIQFGTEGKEELTEKEIKALLTP